MLKKFSLKQKRLIAIVLASVMLLTSLAIGLASTFAAKPPMVGDFSARPNNFDSLSVGATITRTAFGAAYANSSNTAVATTPGGRISGSVSITGQRAGTAVISVGSTAGLVFGLNFQVFDDDNIVKYSIPNGGEVFFSAPDRSVASPVTIETGVNTADANEAAFGRIEWASLQPAIAEVDGDTGAITANARGAAIILGRFVDKWGAQQTLHVLVGVEVSLGNTDIDALLRALGRGRQVQADADNHPERFDPNELIELNQLIEEGERVLENPASTNESFMSEAEKINTFIDGMQVGDPASKPLIPGPGEPPSSWLRPSGNPSHVYEVLDEDKQSQYPPVFLYNPGETPGDENDQPAFGPSRGLFYLEGIEGSNIFKPLDRDGEMQDDSAIWGGPDQTFDTDDDTPAERNEDTGIWFAFFGQNVYQEIDTVPGSITRGRLIGHLLGAGADGQPGTADDLDHIFQHVDGKFFSGPHQQPGAPIAYFIGDSPAGIGGNGDVSSSGNGAGGYTLAATDSRWYMDSQGNMTTTPPAPYTVDSVAIDPLEIDVANGSGFRFMATVSGTENPPQAVLWEVIGAEHPHTIIDRFGTLVIAQDETAETLTIRATSLVNPTRSGTATVNVKEVEAHMTRATISRVSIGRSSLIIKDDGSLWGAGRNNRGQLGLGNTTNRSAFTPIRPDLEFSMVSEYCWGDDAHTIALTTDNRVFTWGLNNFGQLGDNTTTQRTTPIEITSRIPGKVVFVAAGAWSTAAVTEDGSLFTWGRNEQGQLGDGTTTRRLVPTRVTFPAGVRIKSVNMADQFTVALTEDGFLFAWGRNADGQLGDGTTTRRTTPNRVFVGGAADFKIKDFSAKSMHHVLAVTESGDLYAWGSGANGRIGNNSTANVRTPLHIMPGLKFEMVATGYRHSMALTTDGRIYAWGQNDRGHVGVGNTAEQRVPRLVAPNLVFKTIAAGEEVSMGITLDGQLYLWGANQFGQFGNGTTTRSLVPLLVPLA